MILFIQKWNTFSNLIISVGQIPLDNVSSKYILKNLLVFYKMKKKRSYVHLWIILTSTFNK
jgi:hypothetical protein